MRRPITKKFLSQRLNTLGKLVGWNTTNQWQVVDGLNKQIPGYHFIERHTPGAYSVNRILSPGGGEKELFCGSGREVWAWLAGIEYSVNNPPFSS